jgi:hypothetical protein
METGPVLHSLANVTASQGISALIAQLKYMNSVKPRQNRKKLQNQKSKEEDGHTMLYQL